MSTDVQSKLTYVYDDGKRPHLYARPRTRADPHKTDYGGSPDLVNVLIRDGRKHKLTLDENAFELVEQETALNTSDFKTNENAIKTTYYEEIENLIKNTTGADQVLCFHHQVRDGTRTANGKSSKQYATDVHTDSSPFSAEQTFFEALEALGQKVDDVTPYKTGRFLYVNAWRNIADTPIMNNHLAVCDETSLVKPDDYIAYDYFEPYYASVHYNLSSRNYARHRWYYFPKMTREEIILFKQYDSDPELSGRMCFHAAFEDRNAPRDCPPRQSIEVRAVAFFPDHEPNTCPRMDGHVRMAVSKVLQAVDYANEWPRMDRWWFVDKVKKGDCLSVLDSLLADKRNELGLKGKDEEFLSKVRSMAIEEGFAVHATRAATLMIGPM